MRRLAVFVALLPLLILSRGCGGLSDLPVVVYVESDFTDAELDQVLWAMDEWNAAIAEVTGSDDPVIIYGGRVTDTFNIGDLSDGRHVIYKVSERGTVADSIGYNDTGDTHAAGHGVQEDIHVLYYMFSDWDEVVWLRMLQVITLHEFGHTPFGLMHFGRKRVGIGIMNPRIGKEMFQHPHITELDMEQYCIAHGCDASGYSPEDPSSGESQDIGAIISYPDEDE